MQSYNILTSFRRCMTLLNIAICLVLTWLFIRTPQYAAQNADGIQFLQQMSTLPNPTWIFLFSLAALFTLIVINEVYQYGKNKWLDPGNALVCWLEIFLCLIIIISLHFDYNGLLLLVVVNLIDELKGGRRELFLAAMALLYLLTSLDVMRTWFGLAPILEYMAYYRLETRQMMQSSIGVLTSLNLILFVIYMAILIGKRTEENVEVRKLNSELEHANSKLSVLNDQLKAFAEESAHMAETKERNRLAREIHDTLGHALTGITAGADACIQMLDVSPEMARKQMELIASTARDGMNEVRRSVKALRPDAVERFQLSEALCKLCENMRATSGAQILLKMDSSGLRLSPDEEDAVYRIVQEGITNAVRHGKATKIWVELAGAWRKLTVVVRDNGAGCSEVKPGFGLKHMQERLRMLGGTLSIDGTDGFEIKAIIPLRWGDEL